MPEYQPIELTETERAAKEFLLVLYREGTIEPCDTEIQQEADLPPWYDEIKYKRGQKYFHDNRIGILNSNFTGLICLLAEPRGLQILSSTGRSSTKETARKRYISTVLHTISWYDIDLAPGSQARKSLSMVRKMHFLASKSAQEKQVGMITQIELALTAFGFMGFPLIRPQILGVRHDNQEDREAFVHLWAVLCHMIGVKEKFNICLLPLPSLEVLCQIFMRYILIPIIQIETPLFREMTQAMLDGLSNNLPHMDYDAQIFMARMICGVPGYQYDVPLENEKWCRSIFTQAEVDECNRMLYVNTGREHIPISVNVPIVNITKIDRYIQVVNADCIIDNEATEAIESTAATTEPTLLSALHEALKLSTTDHLSIRYISDEEEWRNCLNDSKFYSLNTKSQSILRFRNWGRKAYEYTMPRYLMECGVSLLLDRMRKSLKSLN